jgi:flagellar hook-length control protein FliK
VAVIAKAEPKAVGELAKAEAAVSVHANSAQPQPLPPTTHARVLPAAYQPVANPINMGQVAFEMVRQVHQGTSRFTIRLDPPELGRVDVRMQVDPSGTVNARLTVERVETLDMFQRDQRSLERALAQAGLDTARTNLEFSLRQNPFGNMPGGDHRQHQHSGSSGPQFSLAATEEASPAPAVTLYRGIASAGGVNIFA